MIKAVALDSVACFLKRRVSKGGQVHCLVLEGRGRGAVGGSDKFGQGVCVSVAVWCCVALLLFVCLKAVFFSL